jgi:hypothetical protein
MEKWATQDDEELREAMSERGLARRHRAQITEGLPLEGHRPSGRDLIATAKASSLTNLRSELRAEARTTRTTGEWEFAA